MATRADAKLKVTEDRFVNQVATTRGQLKPGDICLVVTESELKFISKSLSMRLYRMHQAKVRHADEKGTVVDESTEPFFLRLLGKVPTKWS